MPRNAGKTSRGGSVIGIARKMQVVMLGKQSKKQGTGVIVVEFAHKV